MFLLTIVACVCGYFSYDSFRQGDTGLGIVLALLAVMFMVIRVSFRSSCKSVVISKRSQKSEEEIAREELIRSLNEFSNACTDVIDCVQDLRDSIEKNPEKKIVLANIKMGINVKDNNP